MRAPRIAATHQECKAVKLSAIAMALWFLLVLFATESNKATNNRGARKTEKSKAGPVAPRTAHRTAKGIDYQVDFSQQKTRNSSASGGRAGAPRRAKNPESEI